MGKADPLELRLNIMPNQEDLRRLYEQQQANPGKRTYSKGRLGPEDDGDLYVQMAVDKERKKIIIDFGKSVTWVALDPEGAKSMAELILAKVKEME